MEQFETKARARITGFTAALFVAIASLAFLATIPFLPNSPVLPLIVALGLGALSFRNRGVAVTAMYLLVFVAILWQMIGFGFFQLLRAGVGGAVLAAMILPLFLFVSKRVELTSMSIGVLCVALMFTPAYFVSIPLIAATATVTGFASLEALSGTFIMFLAPFLMLENAIYFVTVPSASAPIIFGQLSYLSQNFRPALPGLNLFLTSLPGNLISPRAQAVSVFLAQDWAVLIIPLLLMGVVILASSIVGSLASRWLTNFGKLREWDWLRRVGSPLAVSLVVPLAFVLLIVPLSFPGSGGFQTSLTNDQSHFQLALMVASSVLLGGAFVARESLARRLEGAELGRDRVLGLLRECKDGISRFRTELEEVKGSVPTLSLVAEENSLSEFVSYLGDVERQVGVAGEESLSQWTSYMEASVLPKLRRSEETLVNGVLNELRSLGAVIRTVNSNLTDASAPMLYSEIPEAPWENTVQEAVELYGSATTKIVEETKRLFDSYKSNYEAFAKLTDMHETSIPMGPLALLNSHEYVTAMRLVSEEYWLGFHLRYSEELESKKGVLAVQLERLEALLQEDQLTTVSRIIRSVAEAKPTDSVALLRTIEELRSFLDSVLSWLGSGPELVEKTLLSIGPKSSKVVTFLTTRHMDEVLVLKKELARTGAGIERLAEFIKAAISVLGSQVAAWKSDQENLVVLAHYPLARKVIGRMLAERNEVGTSALPYERRTAEVYERLYALEHPGVGYDEQKGVLRSA